MKKYSMKDASRVKIFHVTVDDRKLRQVACNLAPHGDVLVASESGPFTLNGSAKGVTERVSRDLLNAMEMILNTFDRIEE